ncbi:MAG: host attachment protein [Novosphingobium sp.]
MLIPHGTVIALADGKHLELYRNDGDEGQPEFTGQPSPKLDSHNHSAGSHHSSAGNPDGQMVIEDAHAGAAVAWLNNEVLGHRIEHLVVIAAPRTLGEMRKHYSKQLEGVLLCELHKDLIGKAPAAILTALREKQ